MLLGQNVNSYGKNLENPITFAQVASAKSSKIEGLERIRFMTSHPKDLSDELIDVMGHSKKICRHLHLPLQSGSSDILKSMNRQYTKESYLDLVDRIRKGCPGYFLDNRYYCGLSGRNRRGFLRRPWMWCEKVGYDSAFTFIYSKTNRHPGGFYGESGAGRCCQGSF